MRCQHHFTIFLDKYIASLFNTPVPDQNQQLFDLRALHPGKMLREKLSDRGWTQDQLAAITGLGSKAISLIVTGKSGISADTAKLFAAAFGNTPEEWLKWDAQYRLSIAEADVTRIERRARLYSLAPIRDMQKRGWISETDDLDTLEGELKQFFGVESLEGEVTLPVATYRTITLPSLNAAEKAWCFRARKLASVLPVPAFAPTKVNEAEKEVRKLAAYPKEARHLTEVLAAYGIRFVVVEPLPSVKIDGAAFWLNPTSPVIAVSLRFDRVDAFWFTVMHECAHIKNGDAVSVDKDLIDGTAGIAVMLVEDEAERRANEQASASLIPPQEFDSFVRRVGPLYSKERIIQFAHKVRIHPGIIVGQLQHKNEIGYSANREMLVKIRSAVIETAMTDGWNRSITPGLV
jgi:HTH-type transcriptional regulator / antitoxin HigA